MDDRMIMLPLPLVQRMVNILQQMPYGTVCEILDELKPYKAEQPGLASVPTDPPDPTPIDNST